MRKISSFGSIGGFSRLVAMIAIVFATNSFALERNENESFEQGAPDEIRKVLKQAKNLTRAGLLERSEELLRANVLAYPQSSAIKLELAFVLSKRRKLVEAYDLAYPITQTETKNARAFSVLGAIMLAAGKFPDARIVYYNSLKLDRDDDLAWAGVGLIDFYENRIDESLKNLREAVYQDPNEPDYLFALALVSSRAERYRDAADAYFRFLSVSKDTDVNRRARIKGLINFLRFLGQKESLYVSIGKESAKVDFDLVGNRPIIKVKVNGRDEPLRFVLDTGSGITVMSETTANRLKIKTITRGGFATGLGGDGKFAIAYGYLKNVEIGDVNVRNVPIFIRKFHDQTAKADGYIGLALISKFLTTIDYGSKTFSLTKKADDEEDHRENATMSLPLRLTSSGFLSGEVLLEGIPTPLNFIVDTGASVSVISDQVATADSIRDTISPDRLRVIGSAGVTDGVPMFMLPKVSFGIHSQNKIAAIALDLDIINEATGFEQAGILGGNFLKNYSLTFDFKNSKVTFRSVVPQN